jgi:hypothetical protein
MKSPVSGSWKKYKYHIALSITVAALFSLIVPIHNMYFQQTQADPSANNKKNVDKISKDPKSKSSDNTKTAKKTTKNDKTKQSNVDDTIAKLKSDSDPKSKSTASNDPIAKLTSDSAPDPKSTSSFAPLAADPSAGITGSGNNDAPQSITNNGGNTGSGTGGGSQSIGLSNEATQSSNIQSSGGNYERTGSLGSGSGFN